MRTLLILLTFIFMAGSALAEDFVGSIKNTEGETAIIRQGETLGVQPGDHVLRSDILRTRNGSLGVLFRDDTALSLGKNTELAIAEFIFDPHGGNLDFLIRMTRGSAAFVTGQMGRIRPESVKVETPQSTIGIRGTRFVVEVN